MKKCNCGYSPGFSMQGTCFACSGQVFFNTKNSTKNMMSNFKSDKDRPPKGPPPPPPPPRKPVYIGVDPAFRAGGFWACILDTSDRTADFKLFTDVLNWHDWLRSDDAPANCFICIENSNLQNKTFAYAEGGSRAHAMKMSRNIGCNQAVSQLAYDSAVGRYGKSRVYGVSPEGKGDKYTTAQFHAVLKSDGVTIMSGVENQDARDAYKLACIAKRMALTNKFK